MRRVTAILSAATIALMAAGLAAQGRPTFAGEWKKDVPMGQGEPGVDLIITQGAAAMTVEDMKAPSPAKLTYKLDGSVSKNTVTGRAGGAPAEQASTAMWAGNRLVVTTTTGAGEETRTFSMAGDSLVIETSAPRNGGSPNVTKTTYNRYVRGFGG